MKGKNVPGRDVKGTVPFVRLDPQHQTTVGGKVIEIPDPAYQVETLLSARKADYVPQELDKEDMAIFELDVSKASASQTNHYDLDGDDDYIVTAAPVPSKGKTKPKPKDDWKSDSERLANVVENLMLPPIPVVAFGEYGYPERAQGHAQGTGIGPELAGSRVVHSPGAHWRQSVSVDR